MDANLNRVNLFLDILIFVICLANSILCYLNNDVALWVMGSVVTLLTIIRILIGIASYNSQRE